MSGLYIKPSREESLKDSELYMTFNFAGSIEYIQVKDIKDYDDKLKKVYLKDDTIRWWDKRYVHVRSLMESKELVSILERIKEAGE